MNRLRILLVAGFSAALLLLAAMVWHSARPVEPSPSPFALVNLKGQSDNNDIRTSPALPANSVRARGQTRGLPPRPRRSKPLVRELSASTAFARGIRREGTPPSHDLAMLHMLVKDYRKVHGVVPPALNSRELASMLLGKNPTRSRFLPPDCPALDDEGRLLDRWDAPLYVHLLSDRKIELRSAGPDGTMWNEDDILVN